MKKRLMFALLLVAAVAAVAVVSCKKEDSEFEKGKKDGQATCNCLQSVEMPTLNLNDQEAYKAAMEAYYKTLDACMKFDESKINDDEEDETKWSDYQKGAYEGMKECWGDEEEGEEAKG